MRRTSLAAMVSALVFLPGSFLVARAAWVKAKGEVGEVLINRALDATLKDGNARRPWSWADMHPIARVTVPRLGIERPVLSNATGSALAFGIGHVDGTAAPGASGNCVLAGHRDSWASFLADLQPEDSVVVEAPGGRAAYRVAKTAVVGFDDARVLRDDGEDRLTLVTCWPFRGWLHSPWRYVVRCERVPPPVSYKDRRTTHRASRDASTCSLAFGGLLAQFFPVRFRLRQIQSEALGGQDEAGTSRRKLAASPGVLSSVTSPRMSRASPREIDSPRPIPGFGSVESRFPRSNGSKMDLACPSGIPGP